MKRLTQHRTIRLYGVLDCSGMVRFVAESGAGRCGEHYHQRGAHIMAGANRRKFPAGLAFAAGGLALSAVLALAASIGTARANGAEPSPLSVVQALMDAERETDLELALSLFAKDAVIVNVIGDTIESAQLPPFLELDMWLNESFALEQAAVERNRVTWTKSITAPFYEHIGVAPIRFAFAADVRNGKINSIVAHVPLEEIVRIETACGRQTPEPRIYDKPCSAFIQRLAAQSAFTTTAARDRVEMKVE